jgi:hypothetical protein
VEATIDAPGDELRQFLTDSRGDGADELLFARFSEGRVLCRASGRPSMRLCERLEAEGAETRELLRLEALWSQLAPARVGYFREWGPEPRYGWCFSSEIPVERVRGLAIRGWPNQRLGLFCARHGIGHCGDLSHAVDGSRQVRVRLPLPESGDALPIALDAFATLCTVAPPRALWDLVAGARLDVEVRLDENEADVRLRVRDPDDPLLDAAFGSERRCPPKLGRPVAIWIEPRGGRSIGPRRGGYRLAPEYRVRR